MNYKFVDIMPKDNKGYKTIEDMILGIVKYLYKEMDYNDYFKGSEVLAICTLIYEELFENKNNYKFDYRFWLLNQYQLLAIASNSLYIQYQNDDFYGGKIFPDYIRDDDKLLLDKIDNYLKSNGKYDLEPHTYDHNLEFDKHFYKILISDEFDDIFK